MSIIIVQTTIKKEELEHLAKEIFGNMVKGVINVQDGILAFGGEMHSDIEAVLLENGARQEDLWGFNIYPELSHDSWIEYTSLINIRPKQANNSMEIQDEKIRLKIKNILDEKIV